MFTGIVECTGKVCHVDVGSRAMTMRVACSDLPLGNVSIGDSISVNGVCLTVTMKTIDELEFNVSQETLRLSAGFSQGMIVNLERALTLQSLIGGHLVSGHIDGVAVVDEVIEIEGNWEVKLNCPRDLMKYLVMKGSITLNGESLTINKESGHSVYVNLIPHTIDETNLQTIKVGTRVNLEIDMFARYIEKLISRS